MSAPVRLEGGRRRTHRALRTLSVDLSMAQLAVAWVLQNPNVSAAIIGASRPEQVAENAAASGIELEDTTLQQIDEILSDSVVHEGPAS